MATLSKLKVGQTLYKIQSQYAGNTTVKRRVCYEVVVKEILPDGAGIMASWNGNPPVIYRNRDIKKLRVNKPTPKGTLFGMPNY